MELNEAMQPQAKALADPSRFGMFRHIADANKPVSVTELVELLGFNPNAIRQHLAVLVESGLIWESDEPRTTRGRPRKQYEARSDALHAFRSVSGSYERLAELLLDMHESGDTPHAVGHRSGSDSGVGESPVSPASDQSTEAILVGLVNRLGLDGFEPALVADQQIDLCHCPFADLARRDPGVICEIHRGLIDGHLSRFDGAVSAELTVADPSTAPCRVTLTSHPSND